MNNGTVEVNSKSVAINGFDGVVTNGENGSVEINLGTKISPSNEIRYGVTFANDLKPEDLMPSDERTVEQILDMLNDPSKIVNVSAEAGTKFILASAASFEKEGYKQEGWLDESGSVHFSGSVDIDSPYWFTPYWVALEPGFNPKPRTRTVTASKAARSFVLEIVTPDVEASEDRIDGRVGVLLGNTFAEMREASPLSVELDGKALTDEQYTVVDHNDGSFTVLFSNDLISALSSGTHPGAIRVGDAEIAFALTVAAV